VVEEVVVDFANQATALETQEDQVVEEAIQILEQVVVEVLVVLDLVSQASQDLLNKVIQAELLV
jgi:hypothetical protein